MKWVKKDLLRKLSYTFSITFIVSFAALLFLLFKWLFEQGLVATLFAVFGISLIGLFAMMGIDDLF